MKSPLDDTIWGAQFGSVPAIQAAFDRFGIDYHNAILTSGVPQKATGYLWQLAGLEIAGESVRGIDLGCGSGVLGMGLRTLGYCGQLRGIDVSPRMLEIAGTTGSYTELSLINLMAPENWVALCDFDLVISVGLVGDYMPYYMALPRIREVLKPGGLLALAVEQRSTAHLALLKLFSDLDFTILGETSIEVNEDYLELQTYEFYVARKAVLASSPDPAG